MLQDLIAVLREHSADPEAFDAFVQQWFFEVVVPRYRLGDAEVVESGGRWQVTATLENAGTGSMPVEVAAMRGVRFRGEDDEEAEAFEQQRLTLVLGAGESRTFSLSTDFEPQELVVDPDAVVLQLMREQAKLEL